MPGNIRRTVMSSSSPAGPSPRGWQLRGLASAALMVAGLAGCVTAPPPRMVERIPAEAPPDTELTAYPMSGQSRREVAQDRYECHLWAVQRSGFDPSRTRLTAPPPVPHVEPNPPVGYDTAAGALTGAVIGAAVANPHNTGTGAAIGAAVGAAAGAASDSARAAQAQRIQDAYAARAARSDYGNWQQADAYRRAMGACLSGRGYSVR